MMSCELDVASINDTINDAVQSVPYLQNVYGVCKAIVPLAHEAKANQRAMVRLCKHAALFVKSLAERSRSNASFSDSLQTNIDSVNKLFYQIKLFVEKESAKSFMQQALGQAKTANAIKQFSTQISQLVQWLQVDVIFDSNSLILAVKQDMQQIVDMMLAIQNNNEAMNAKMNEMLNDAKLQNHKLETLESINDEIRADLASIPDQIRYVTQKLLPIVQERIQQSSGRKLSPRFDWTINPDDVNIDWNAKIDKGEYSTIYKAVYRNKRVVVKVIDKIYVDQQAAEAIEKKASIWYPLHHPNILPIWGLCMNVEKPFLVMPMIKCDLSRYISTHPDLDMQTRIKIITSIASGMKYLNGRVSPIVHGNLKANNVLVGFDDEICITHFLFAIIKTMSKSNTRGQSDVARWVAPEKYKKGYKLVPSADVFAFAMTCIEIITGKVPFPKEREERIVVQWIIDGYRPNRSENVPDYLWSLIEDCWHQEPDKRPTFRQIVDRLNNPEHIPVEDVVVFPIDTPIYTPTPAPKILESDPLPAVNVVLSLGKEVAKLYKIPGAVRTGIDCAEADACKEAVEMISADKPASDACWEMVVRLHDKAAGSGDFESCFELAWLHFAGIGAEKSDLEAFAYWKRVMSKSDDVTHKTISMYMVGLCYYLGVGTKKDLVKGWKLINESKSDEFVLGGQWAFDWIWSQPIDKIQSSSRVSKVFFDHVKFGSENNNLMKHLEAVCYFYGFGTETDQKKAVEMFTSLANGGFAASQVMLGSCYHEGCIVSKSHDKATEWFKCAAERGYAAAQLCLGYCYSYGEGVAADDHKAHKWMLKAADQGHGDAQYHLGCYYRDGKGVSKDYGKAVEWFQKAVDQGVVDAQNALGDCYRDDKGVQQDHAKAVGWFQKAADLGHVGGQFNLGFSYYAGKGVPQDYGKAVEWLQKSAEQGHMDAQLGLADCYHHGRGVSQDHAVAFGWFQKAADQGSADAQWGLGDCYYNGEGVPQDFAKAVEWYRKAADQDHADAQCLLARCYRDGEGVPADPDTALEWFKKAADQGHIDAKRDLRKLNANSVPWFPRK